MSTPAEDDAPAQRPTPAGAQTLERGLRLLVELARHPQGLSVTEAAEQVELHRSVTHRLLVSLERTGFASRDAAGRYRAGLALTELADQVRPQVRDIARPVLERLAAELDATASLVEVVGDSAVATVVAEPPTDGPRFSYRLGNRDPLDRGAGGIAALAAGSPAVGEPERVTRTREAGHVLTRGELNPGAFGLAAPIPNAGGIRACVNVVTHREDVATGSVDAVVAAAAEIASRLRG